MAAAQSGGEHAVTFGDGVPMGVVAVRGTDAPPHVALVGPNGVRVEAPAPDLPLKTDDAVVFHDTETKTTYLVVRNPAAGRWLVESLPGSSAIAEVRHADGIEKPEVKARVVKRGSQYSIAYEIKGIPGQKVRFAEEAEGVAQEFGEAKGAKGTLRFRPADGPRGRRAIVALVEQNGVPREKLPVTAYAAPGPVRPAKPAGLKATRRGTRLQVVWRPASRAVRYRVRVKLKDGRSLLFMQGANQRRLTIPAVTSTMTGRITVEGLRADGLAGRPAAVALRAVRRRG